MRATQVLQRCLSDAVVPMHAGRRQALFKATESLLHGRRLTLMDLARSWPDAQRVRAPLKALDRLLGNHHLEGERLLLHAAMSRWLLRHPQPVIVVDWCDLKAARSWHLLRAGLAVSGRTLTLLDAVFPDGMQGSPVAEKQFLEQLAKVMPAGCTPIMVTDAGFRAPWFRQVEALGMAVPIPYGDSGFIGPLVWVLFAWTSQVGGGFERTGCRDGAGQLKQSGVVAEVENAVKVRPVRMARLAALTSMRAAPSPAPAQPP